MKPSLNAMTWQATPLARSARARAGSSGKRFFAFLVAVNGVAVWWMTIVSMASGLRLSTLPSRPSFHFVFPRTAGGGSGCSSRRSMRRMSVMSMLGLPGGAGIVLGTCGLMIALMT